MNDEQTKKFVESLSDQEVSDLVMDFRLSSVGAKLTKQLKDEWRACLKYCEKRRKHNWDNRKIGSGTQGMSGDGVRQERMKLPTIAELEVEKHFGKNWHGEKAANDWAWKKFPQFRLIEKK